MNLSPNIWSVRDTAHVYSGPGSLPALVTVVSFEKGLVRVRMPDGSHRWRAFDGLHRI